MSTKLKTKMLKTQNSKLKTFKGFTIVELLVAMGLFVVLIGNQYRRFCIKAFKLKKRLLV